jgi:hypothetical protein
MEPRVMISINFFLDPAVAALTDFQKITFLQCIIASKRMRSAGKFKSVEHLKAVLDSARARAIPALLKEDLLVVGEDDVVTIRNYSRYQVDLTSNARQEKFRARNRGGITHRTEREQELNITPISPSKRDGKSRLLPINEILGVKRNA